MQYRDECRVGQESELIEIRELWMSQGHSMTSPVQDQDSVWSGRSGVWVRAGQDSSTAMADSERDRAPKRQYRDRVRARAEQDTPSRAGRGWWSSTPDLYRPGSEGMPDTAQLQHRAAQP